MKMSFNGIDKEIKYKCAVSTDYSQPGALQSKILTSTGALYDVIVSAFSVFAQATATARVSQQLLWIAKQHQYNNNNNNDNNNKQTRKVNKRVMEHVY